MKLSRNPARVPDQLKNIFALCLLIALLSTIAPAQGGGFIVLGLVSLPNGDPAPRVTVKISSLAGLNREVISNDQGRYEFIGVAGGRYRLTVTNPGDPTHFIEPTEVDTSRSAGNRVIVHLYLRISPTVSKTAKSNVVSVAEASQTVPKEAKKAFEEGLRRKTDKQIDRALESFNRAIVSYPEYFQAFSERGELYIAKSRIPDAIEDFEHALKLNEDYAPALRGLGYCNLEQQKFTEAIRYLERSIVLDQSVANAHLFLGIASLAIGNRDGARTALLEALKIDNKGSVSARVYLSDIYAREERYKEAADELRLYLDARPEAPNAAKLRAREADLRARSRPNSK